MTRSVVFLDIDGVLATWDSYKARVEFRGRRRPGLHSPAVEELQRIIDTTGAEIVLSSSWRSDRDDFQAEVVAYLQSQGVPPIIDRTPDLWPKRRGLECAQWLVDNPGVDRCVALDDDSDLFPIPLVHCTNGMDTGGLTPARADEAISILRPTADEAEGREGEG